MKNTPPAPASMPGSKAIARLALLLLGTPAIVFAQATSPVAPSSQDSEQEEIVVMEDFNVTESSSTDGWVSTQVMSGSRTAENIANLPYQMQVITAEFLEDFDMVSVADQMSLISGFVGDADEAEPGVGFTSDDATYRGFRPEYLRDGMKNAARPQLSNMRQVEVIKGPMSTLYGAAQPGGVINYVSKRPSGKPRYNVALKAGNYDQWGANLTVNTPVYKKKLYLMAVADHDFRKSNLQSVQADTSVYFVSFLYKPTKRTDITVTYEMQHAEGARGGAIPRARSGTSPANSTPGNWDMYTGTILGVYRPLAEMGFSIFGPNEHYDLDQEMVNVILEQHISRNWKLRAMYQWFEKEWAQEYYYYSSSDYCLDPGYQNLRNCVPYVRFQDYNYPYSVQADLLGHFNTGKIRHALLFTADAAKECTEQTYWFLPTSVAVPASVRYQDPFNPDWSTDWFSYADIRSRDREGGRSRLDEATYYQNRMMGFSASERMFLFKGALILMGSIRYDEIDIKYYNGSRLKTDADWQGFRAGRENDITYSMGANWKILGDNRYIIFGNYSTSFNRRTLVDAGTGELRPPETGEGMEAGIKFNSSNGKLSSVLSVFEIEKHNIAETNDEYYVAGDGTPEYLSAGIRRVRGVDMDVTYRPFRGFVVMGGGSYLDAKVMDTADVRTPVGSRMLKVPNKTLAMAAKYSFPGIFKGFSVSARMSYKGGYVRQNYVAANSVTPGARNAEIMYDWNPSVVTWGGYIKYEWKTKKVTQSVALTGKNIFDKLYIGTNRKLSLGRQLIVSYRVSFR